MNKLVRACMIAPRIRLVGGELQELHSDPSNIPAIAAVGYCPTGRTELTVYNHQLFTPIPPQPIDWMQPPLLAPLSHCVLYRTTIVRHHHQHSTPASHRKH